MDTYVVRVIRHASVNGELVLAARLEGPDAVAELVDGLVHGRTAPEVKEGDVITINVMGDFEEWRASHEG